MAMGLILSHRRFQTAPSRFEAIKLFNLRPTTGIRVGAMARVFSDCPSIFFHSGRYVERQCVIGSRWR